MMMQMGGRDARRNKNRGVSDADILRELDEAVQRKNREKMMEAQREKQEIMNHYHNYNLGVSERANDDFMSHVGGGGGVGGAGGGRHMISNEPEVIRTRSVFSKGDESDSSKLKDELFGSSSPHNNYARDTAADDGIKRRPLVSRRVFSIFDDDDNSKIINSNGHNGNGNAMNDMGSRGVVGDMFDRRKSKRDEVYERKKQLHLARQMGFELDEEPVRETSLPWDAKPLQTPANDYRSVPTIPQHSPKQLSPHSIMPAAREESRAEPKKHEPSFFDRFESNHQSPRRAVSVGFTPERPPQPQPQQLQQPRQLISNPDYENRKKSFIDNVSKASGGGGLFDKLGYNEQPKGRAYGTAYRAPDPPQYSPQNQRFDSQDNVAPKLNRMQDNMRDDSAPKGWGAIGDAMAHEVDQRKREQSRRALEYQREIEQQIREKEERLRLQKEKEKEVEEREYNEMMAAIKTEPVHQRKRINFDEPSPVESPKHVPNRQQLFSNDVVAPSPPAQGRNGALKYSEPGAVSEREARLEKQKRYQMELAAQAEEQRRAKELQKKKEMEEERREAERIEREIEEERRLVELEQQKKAQEAKELENKKLLAQQGRGKIVEDVQPPPPKVEDSFEKIAASRRARRNRTIEPVEEPVKDEPIITTTMTASRVLENRSSNPSPPLRPSPDTIVPSRRSRPISPQMREERRTRTIMDSEEGEREDEEYVIEERIITRVPKSLAKRKKKEKSEKDVAELLANYLEGIASNFNAVKDELDSVKRKLSSRESRESPKQDKSPVQESFPQTTSPEIERKLKPPRKRESIELGKTLEADSIFLFARNDSQVPMHLPPITTDQVRNSARRIRSPKFTANIHKLGVDNSVDSEEYIQQTLETNIRRNKELEAISAETSREKAKEMVGQYLTNSPNIIVVPNGGALNLTDSIQSSSSVNTSLTSPHGRRSKLPGPVVEQSLPSNSKFISNMQHMFDSDSGSDLEL